MMIKDSHNQPLLGENQAGVQASHTAFAVKQHEAFLKGAVSKQELREHFRLAGGKQEHILLLAFFWEGAEEVYAAKGAGLTKSRLDASVQQCNGKALREAGNPGGTPVGEGLCAVDQMGTPPCLRPSGDRYLEMMLLSPLADLPVVAIPPQNICFFL